MGAATTCRWLRGTRRRLAVGLILAAASTTVGAVPVVAHAESTSTSCAGVPGKSFVTTPEGWANQCQMVNDPNIFGVGLDRQTWVLDPGIGNFLTREQLLANTGNYEQFGFTQRFLWYAPMTQVHPDPSSKWSACNVQFRSLLTFCSKVNTSPSKTIGQDLKDDTLDAISYGSDWIALGCGNFHLPVAGSTPAPVIRGFKFADENRDGVQDNGESGLGGIVFTLSRVGSLVGQSNLSNLATATSDSNGNFSFSLNRDDEGPGVYVVTEQYTSDWPNTTPLSQTIVVPEGAGDGEHLPTLLFGDRREIPPVAVASPQQVDQQSVEGSQVTLDGSGSYSPTGDPLTYTWTGPFGTAVGVHPTVLMPPGTSEVTLTVSDGIKSDSTSTTITVFPPITAHAESISAVEGNAFNGTVATFTDPDPAGSAADYIATIDWGDGSAPSAGTIAKGSDGTFAVTGEHTYADEGSYQVSVTITDDDVAYNTATVMDTATVDDAPLSAQGVDFLSTNPVDQTLATFTDGNPQAPVSDFSATIDWGDGTPATKGQVFGATGGLFTVSGSHTYATLGYKTITIHIVDDGGSTATAFDHVLLYQPSGFVIGDRNSADGTRVTFWGAQWSKVNQLSGGPAPDAFKGYESNPGASTTLNGWTTEPGNSSIPPATVPTFMSVIISSSITQKGSTISGNAPHIAIVETDEGYTPDPGHSGTGTVVAELR
jgi:hypothetical protein